MPRIAGQIDVVKNEAILDAALDVLAERGLNAPLEAIARRAGVSKQTIYNHYGSKAELVRAIMDRRVATITAPLEVAGAAEHPQEALAGFARSILQGLVNPRARAFMRMTLLGAAESPELARTFYEAGPAASRARLARFLEQETARGRLAVDDAASAAELFTGMVNGSRQMSILLGFGAIKPGDVDRIAQQAAERFLRAYAPAPPPRP